MATSRGNMLLLEAKHNVEVHQDGPRGKHIIQEILPKFYERDIQDLTRNMSFKASDTVFVFPSNLTDHTDETTLYSQDYKRIPGMVSIVAAELREEGVATLGLPTTGMDKYEKDPKLQLIAKEAMKNLWKAAGYGLTVVIPVRPNRQFGNKVGYFDKGFENEALEPRMEPNNPALANYYMEKLELLRKYLAGGPMVFANKDDEELLAAYKQGKEARAQADAGRDPGPWFQNPMAASHRSHIESVSSASSISEESVDEGDISFSFEEGESDDLLESLGGRLVGNFIISGADKHNFTIIGNELDEIVQRQAHGEWNENQARRELDKGEVQFSLYEVKTPVVRNNDVDPDHIAGVQLVGVLLKKTAVNKVGVELKVPLPDEASNPGVDHDELNKQAAKVAVALAMTAMAAEDKKPVIHFNKLNADDSLHKMVEYFLNNSPALALLRHAHEHAYSCLDGCDPEKELPVFLIIKEVKLVERWQDEGGERQSETDSNYDASEASYSSSTTPQLTRHPNSLTGPASSSLTNPNASFLGPSQNNRGSSIFYSPTPNLRSRDEDQSESGEEKERKDKEPSSIMPPFTYRGRSGSDSGSSK